ncbi:LacI family DNA-binding transcriptional regulator [Lentilactobacillus sp. Marseille-Q4993]|uniref:LacI family DNA-binding transcriptional regulator n=1 Tax=Lentilactobacillus sp. Marseille-Q4993 TaxID=3039492 RepID=UPI0024BC3D98|nr:LacI family DNA-binding transcriptional regulator [Lentilactobacillus sp. Marseille-Q4993]
MATKLKDVAQLAGVSVTTVSRVINNNPVISEKTVLKVREAMRALNYQPNALARAMQGKSSRFIGLILPNLTNPFYAELVNVIERKLFKKRYKAIIASSANNEQIEHEYLGMLMANQVEGVISSSHNLGIEEYSQASAPIVSFDRYLADSVPTVSADNAAGGRYVAQYMVDHGATRVALMSEDDSSNSPTIARTTESIKILEANGIKYESIPVDAEVSADLFPGDFDGVIASNDVTALQIARLARDEGRKPFEDFLITGYDGSEFVRDICPELPTVVQPIDEIADRLIDTLLAQCEDGAEMPAPEILPVKFED